MVYKQKFTENDAIEILQGSPKTTYELTKFLHSSKVTSLKLLSRLEEKGMVGKRNRGSPDRPIWEYFLTEKTKSTIQSKKPNQKLSSMLRSLKN